MTTPWCQRPFYPRDRTNLLLLRETEYSVNTWARYEPQSPSRGLTSWTGLRQNQKETLKLDKEDYPDDVTSVQEVH